MHKTKPISKSPAPKHRQPKTPITTKDGDPLIKTLSDFVTSLKITYTNQPLYTGGRITATEKHLYSSCNKQITVYSFEHATLIDRIKHENEQIINFCVCPEDKYIATFTQNGMARVLHIQTKKLLHAIKMKGNFSNDIQFSPDGRHLAFVFGNVVHIHSFPSMKLTHSYNPTNSQFAITKLQWHPNPDKLQLYTCDMQRNIALFDYILNKVIASSVTSDGGTEFCLANNGETLIAINNLQIKVYASRNLELRYTIVTEEFMESLHSIDNHIYLGGQETQLYSFPLSQSTPTLKIHQGCTDNGVEKIMSIGKATHRKLLVLSSEQNISILRICNNHHFEYEGMIVGYNDEIIDIKHSKLGASPYLVMVTNSNNVKILNTKTHRLEYLIKGHTHIVLCADYWHPYVATAGKDNTLKLWKINQQLKRIDLLVNYSGHSGNIVSLVALPANKMLATVSQDLTIKLWQITPQGPQKQQIKSAIRTAIAHQKSINSVRASPHEDILVTCSQDKTLKLWNHQLTTILSLAGHHRGVWDAAFHPVEQMLVSAGGDGMLKGWNMVTGECLWSMGEGEPLIRCCWVYYNQVVTGSQDGIIKIWDIRKQTSLSYDKHQGKIWALDTWKNVDGRAQLVSGASDSKYYLWIDNTEEIKLSIINQYELEEQQKIFYQQNIRNKKYCDAAIVAFKANYTKLFIHVLQKMEQNINAELPPQEDALGKLVTSQAEYMPVVTEEEFATMLARLKQIDFPRLLISLQSMTSTIRSYKSANRLLLGILKTTPFSQLLAMNNNFELPSPSSPDLAEFNAKKSSLSRWLQSMIGFEQRHSSRLNKYIIGTHWIEHLYKIDHPFSI